MKKRLFTFATVLALQATGVALAQDEFDAEGFDETARSVEAAGPVVRDHRTPKGDLIVKAINIQQTITDDVSNTPTQMVTITVQNIGNRAVRASSNEIQMNGPHYNTSVYGPNGSIPNSYLLGAAIGPGQLGLMSFYLPPGTLKHCQKVSGVIDTRHTLQFGPYEQVFYNDSLGDVYVIDRSAQRICIGGRTIPREPIIMQ